MRRIRREIPKPHFWWDFVKPSQSPILVESDHKQFPVLAVLPFRPSACYHEPDSAMAAIERANTLIQALNEGRANFRSLGAEVPSEFARRPQ
jgi:hypothetical protein